jgi:hypothetical protein
MRLFNNKKIKYFYQHVYPTFANNNKGFELGAWIKVLERNEKITIKFNKKAMNIVKSVSLRNNKSK